MMWIWKNILVRRTNAKLLRGMNSKPQNSTKNKKSNKGSEKNRNR